MTANHHRRLIAAMLFDGVTAIAYAGMAGVLYQSPYPWMCVVAVALGIFRR